MSADSRQRATPADARKMEEITDQQGLLVVGLLSIVVWAPWLYPGFIQTHSGLGAVYDALAAGLPFSGWLPSYGTPGDGPLATWLVVILKMVSEPLAAVKLLYVLGIALSGMGMFLLARRLWGGRAALAAAAVYMLAPYHLLVVYVRGALAESLVLAGAPWLFSFVDDAMHGGHRRALATVALATVVFVLLNIGLGVLFAALALTWSALRPVVAESPDGRRQKPGHAAAVGGVALGLLAGLLVLLPAGGRLLANEPGWHDHFVQFFQLFWPGWGFGVSVPGWQDGLSFQLGVAPVALAIIAIWGAWETTAVPYRRAVAVSLVLLCLLIVLVLPLSAPLWRVLRLQALLAYPWQLLALATLLLALLAGAAAAWVLREIEIRLDDAAHQGGPAWLVVLAVLLAAIVLASHPFLAPRFADAADLPDLGHAPLAQLGDDILLLEVRLGDAPATSWGTGGAPEARPGSDLRLTLVWQALRQPAADYTIFAQIFDAAGVKRGQQDMRPHNGAKPTNTWLPGEVVRDELIIPVAPDAPLGDHHLSVGMYQLATMERLPVAGADRREIVLGPIMVR